MSTLPISRLIIFKHGVGYFERRGAHSGERLDLSFPREAMDDMLKSLVALDLGAGQILGVEFETPEDRASRLARGSIHLSDRQSLLDLLRDLRGRRARLALAEGKKGESAVEGLVVGVDYEADEPLRRAVVSVYQPDTRQVRALPLDSVARVDLLDDEAAADLAYFLRAAQSEEQRRSATLRLTPGDHDLLVGYIAPAPAWRVSYRLLFEHAEVGTQNAEAAATATDGPGGPTATDSESGAAPHSAFCILQGWGLFDNQLEEDLAGVDLTLMAGMPVSFRYRLYEPHTPERPLVQDEERTVNAPIAFAAAPPPMAPMPAAAMMADAAESAGGRGRRAAKTERLTGAMLEEAVQVAAGGDERGALFAYHVEHPVSVARGQSAMVPILSRRLPARRDLLYNGAKHPRNPVASLRLENATGLTLERGPVTVLEQGDYAGEAVLPFTRAGAELIVAYAVELGVTVEERRRGERRLHAIRLQDDYAIIEEHDLAITSYELTSALDRPAEVTVEHGRLAGYEVAETRAPDEESAGFARWRVPCAPHSRTQLLVTERRLVSRHEHVRSMSGAQLRDYLAGKLLDPATVRALEGVLALYRQVEEAQQQLRQLEQGRETLYKQQRQIQGNLQPLGHDGDEGALRQRYVAALGQLEDQLAELAAAERRLQEEIARLEDQAAKRLKRLGRQGSP
jgi:hypothetical protein